MKTNALFSTLFVALSSLNLAGAAEQVTSGKVAPADSPYAILESFVGGLWIATLPPQNGGPAPRIEMRFTWNANKQGVHFDSTWFTGDRSAPYTSGMYAWDAAKKKLVIFYTDSSGSLTEGPITQEGNVLAHELTVAKKDGGIDHVRARLIKNAPDVFTNEIYIQKDGVWTKLVEARYERNR